MSERSRACVYVGLVAFFYYAVGDSNGIFLVMWLRCSQDKHKHAVHSLIFKIMGTAYRITTQFVSLKQQHLYLRSFDGIKSAIKRNITNISYFFVASTTHKYIPKLSCARILNFVKVNQMKLFSGGIATVVCLCSLQFSSNYIQLLK